MSDMTSTPDPTGNNQFDTRLSISHLLRSNLFYLVAIPGALGGSVGWLMGLGFQAEIFRGAVWDLLIAIILGAVSGFVLVVVLTNTNRNDMLRLVTLSFLAGWVHQPILEQGVEAIGGGSVRELVNIENATIEFGNLLIQTKSVREHLETGEIESRVAEIAEGLENLSVREEEIVLQLLAQQAQTLDPQDQQYLLDIYATADLDVVDYIPDSERQDILAQEISDVGESIETLAMNNGITVDAGNADEVWLTLEVPSDALENVEKRISVTSDSQDLVAILLNEERVQVGYSDDYAGDLNPQIEELMKAGQNYYLQITEYAFADLEEFSVTFFEEGSDQLINTSTTDAVIASLEPGTRAEYNADGKQAYWLDFIIGEQQQLLIEFNALEDSENDLVVQLYNKNNGVFINEFDDNAATTSINPLVRETLPAGQYSFRVSDYYELGVTDFEIVVLDPQVESIQ